MQIVTAPIPPSRAGRRVGSYSALGKAIRGLEVGQAVVVPVAGPAQVSSLRRHAARAGSETGRKFSVRLDEVENKVGVWRRA